MEFKLAGELKPLLFLSFIYLGCFGVCIRFCFRITLTSINLSLREKRSNGLGLYTYESEDSSGPSRDTSSRDAAAVTSTSKTSVSSLSSSSTVIADAPPKVLDPISDASTQSSVSHKREFYFTDSLVEGVGRDLKTSLPTSGGDREAGTLLVQQRPQEISFEFRVS